MKSWFFIDKTGDKFYICPLIEKMGIVAIALNIEFILKRSRGGDIGNSQRENFFMFQVQILTKMEVNNGKTRNPFVGSA